MTLVQLFDTSDSDPVALTAFLENARSIACAIDAELCGILGADCSTATSEARWGGSRADGLSLCLNMLRYLRPEAGTSVDLGRVDRGISYIQRELAKLTSPSLPPARRTVPGRSA